MISDKSWHQIKVTSGVAIALAVGTAICHPAMAADVVAPIMVVPGSIDRPTTEIAPGGTVILRGSGWPKPDATRPAAERTPVNYPAVIVPPAPPQGIDRNFDSSGIDRNFDTHGLTQPR